MVIGLDQLLDVSDKLIGAGCLGAFCLLVGIVLLWALVIAPRRAVRLLGELKERGYADIDRFGPELTNALNALAPVMIEGTTRFEEAPRQTLNAMVFRAGSHPRYM